LIDKNKDEDGENFYHASFDQGDRSWRPINHGDGGF